MERTKRSETGSALPRSHLQSRHAKWKREVRAVNISSGHCANLCLTSFFLHSSWQYFTDEETMTQKSKVSGLNSHRKQWKWDIEPTLLASEVQNPRPKGGRQRKHGRRGGTEDFWRKLKGTSTGIRQVMHKSKCSFAQCRQNIPIQPAVHVLRE